MTSTTTQYQEEAFADEVFAGEGAAVARLRMQVARIAPYFRVALLAGERGVGKQTVARELHRLSQVSTLAFQTMSAEEFAAGAEYGDVGTVFLRGVELLELDVQACLLRRLKKVRRELRVVLASECDLRGLVAAGRMRGEFFERVGTLEIRVPALRDRLEDLPGMADGMLRRLGASGTFSGHAFDRMRRHEWTGNVRELWSVCQRVASVQDSIEAEALGLEEGAPAAKVMKLDEVIERHVVEVLQVCAGNKLKAAELLGISRSTLYRMLETGAA